VGHTSIKLSKLIRWYSWRQKLWNPWVPNWLAWLCLGPQLPSIYRSLVTN